MCEQCLHLVMHPPWACVSFSLMTEAWGRPWWFIHSSDLTDSLPCARNCERHQRAKDKGSIYPGLKDHVVLYVCPVTMTSTPCLLFQCREHLRSFYLWTALIYEGVFSHQILAQWFSTWAASRACWWLGPRRGLTLSECIQIELIGWTHALPVSRYLIMILDPTQN